MHEILLIAHFIGLAMGVGASFASFALSFATKDLAPAERMAFMMRASAIGKNGSYGLVLLLLSGLGLLFYRGVRETFALGGGAFHAKLTLIVVMIGVFGYMQSLQKRARKEQGGPAAQKLPLVSRALLVLGLAIVICAVIAFK